MPIALSNRRRSLFLALALFIAAIYFFLSTKEFAASVFAAQTELPKLQRAVRLSPGNADYRHRLGRYLEFAAGDPQTAIESLRTAVSLNPYNAHYWFDLAAAYQATGYLDGQRAALERALHAEPTAPDVAWEAANFFLINGEIDRALSEFHVVIENDDSLSDAAMRACWRARPDADALLRDVVPARPGSLIPFATLLTSKNDIDGSLEAWHRLAQLHQKFDRKYLYDYINYLVAVQRPEAAMAVWTENADALGLSAYLPSDDNLIVNGDFSLDILNGGFDWTYVNRIGVHPVLDSIDFRQGHRSLSLNFEGPGITDAGIQQLIPVHGATTYEFSAYYKSGKFEGAGGPQIVLRDAYTHAPLYATDLLNDSEFWKEVHSRVTIPASTKLLLLNVERVPAGSPIRGTLWLGDFELGLPDSSDEADGSADSDSADSFSGSKSASTPASTAKDKP